MEGTFPVNPDLTSEQLALILQLNLSHTLLACVIAMHRIGLLTWLPPHPRAVVITETESRFITEDHISNWSHSSLPWNDKSPMDIA